MGKKSAHSANLVNKVVEVDGVPHVAFFAKTDIGKAKEVYYDYGERSKKIVEDNPFLKS